ncbi:MAG: NUDIX hydrolase [Chitinophagaceae bacterium]|nr:MAG: NUDIX hydrolase [Chitinophagaceae bacterium]
MDEQLNPWKVVRKETAYENNWIRVEHHDVINPAGNPGIYGKVHFRNVAIGIVPVDDEGNTWLVGQYRFTLDQYSWEIPEGGSPEGTLPLDSAKRELLEETGLVAQEWTELLKMYLSNSVTDEVAYIYLARGLQQLEPEPEETEQLEIRKLPLAEAYKMVDEGRITDAMSVAALLKVKTIV